MKKLPLIICLISFSLLSGLSMQTFAKEDELEASYAQTAAHYTNYKDCIKLYKLPYEKLFYLALSSVNGSKYELLEMQSRNGYIIFKADNKEFLISVFKKDKNSTFIKITPCDNSYYFSPQIPQKIFNYIVAHYNNEVKELKF